MRVAVALVFLSASFVASAQDVLYGLWGTDAQCARELITPKGTKHASPFDIRPDWLGHGDVWCRLIWGSKEPTEDGYVATATGLCGEDAVRDYQIRFNLNGENLTVIWNMQHTNGPLQRCESR